MRISENNQTTAFLYARVSTEEQALRGGSLKTQEDTLRQYCLLCNIKIEKIFIEDHSAKTFNRPEWKKLFADLENSSQRPTLLLFTRWDRFSRNTADAYHTIKVLKKLGVEPQAVEQPLDLSVPENKMMLAFYLAIPEVENDRRGLNTKMGIQRAKERGRVVGKAPMGYVNHCYANGLKAILFKEPDASIIRNAFEQLANVKSTIADAYRETVKAGLKCSRVNFWRILQNPIYAGNIKITEQNRSGFYTVPGLHKGIVSVETFNKVQTLLFTNSKRKQCIRGINYKIPLRGFISCPRCSRALYGSGSTGRSARYYYYHCTSNCGYRTRVENIHEFLYNKLSGLTTTTNYINLYENVISDCYGKEMRRLSIKKMKSVGTIEQFTDRIAKAKNLLLDSHIDYREYLDIKSDLENKIQLLGYSIEACIRKQTELSSAIKNRANYLAHPGKFLEKLSEKNKPAFLNSILEKGQNWELVNSNLIFKTPFCVIYGLIDANEELTDEVSSGMQALLKTMANLELVLNE